MLIVRLIKLWKLFKNSVKMGQTSFGFKKYICCVSTFILIYISKDYRELSVNQDPQRLGGLVEPTDIVLYTYIYTYVYTYIYMYMYTHTYMHTYTYVLLANNYVHKPPHILSYIYICVCVYIYIYTHMYVHGTDNPEQQIQRPSGC